MKFLSRTLLVLLTLSMIVALSAAAENKVPQRSDIAPEYKWKVEDIYPDSSAWQVDYDRLESSLPALEAYRGKLGESSDTLLACFKLRDSLELILDNLYVYAYLKLDEDNRVSEYQEMGGRISQLYAKVNQAESFIQPELLELGSQKIDAFLAENPGLSVYAHSLKDIERQKAHILSDKEEAILAMAGPATSAPSRIFNMINDADIDYGTILDTNGEDLHLTKERYYKILESTNRDFRRRANQAYNQAYLKYLNSLAATLTGSVKSDYFYSQARGYNSCLEMSLDQNDIPVSVFKNLVKAVDDNLEPLHKWTAIRKRILGYDTLYTYDLSVPLLPDQQKEYTFDEAKQMVVTGLAPLGQDYLANFKAGLDGGWIDAYETQGKGSGAYSWGTYTSHPYVLMNYNNTLEGVFTLAHEMGHAMHSLYTNRSEPYVSHNHPLFTAEVASTGNEAILMKYMLENTTDKQEKMALLNYYIEQVVGTFFTQVMFSEFELAIHERIESGGALSADFMRQTYRGIYQKYWGPELVIDSINDMGCLRISHFYREYYVYQYATCYAAAQVMSQKVLEDSSYVDTYLKFLSTGNSDYPVNVLKAAGVDMTTPEPVERTIKLFASLVDQMEQLLDESGK